MCSCGGRGALPGPRSGHVEGAAAPASHGAAGGLRAAGLGLDRCVQAAAPQRRASHFLPVRRSRGRSVCVYSFRGEGRLLFQETFSLLGKSKENHFHSDVLFFWERLQITTFPPLSTRRARGRSALCGGRETATGNVARYNAIQCNVVRYNVTTQRSWTRYNVT